MSSEYHLIPNKADIGNRISIRIYSVAKFVFFLVIFIMFIVGVLNIFPLIPWGYGFIWHVFEFVAIPLTFFVTWSYYAPIVNIVLAIAILSFLLNGFALGFILYSVIICYLQTIPASCKDMIYTNLITAFISLLLWVFSIVIMFGMIAITIRINKAEIIKRKQR